MKILYDNKGFTLVETLVAINLVLIAVTFIFSFYLFFQKFTGSLSKNYEEKYIIQSLFSKIDLTLRKSDFYTVSWNDNNILIVTENGDSVIITNESISLSNYITVQGSENITLEVILFSNDRVKFESGALTEKPLCIDESSIISYKIRSIDVRVKLNGKEYAYEIITPAFSNKRFNNVEE